MVYHRSNVSGTQLRADPNWAVPETKLGEKTHYVLVSQSSSVV